MKISIRAGDGRIFIPKLAENVNVLDFENQISSIEQQYTRRTDSKNYFYLQSLTSIHLHSSLWAETERPGNPLYIYITGTIGLLILLIACINFMNLSTARLSKRVKEVGIRKVIGAQRKQLIVQFLGESFIFLILSFFIAFIVAGFTLSLLNSIAGKNFELRELIQTGTLLASVLIILFTGFAAGSYPSFYLSVFSPSTVLKSGSVMDSRGSFLRKLLVVSQFSVSIFLLIGTIVVERQLDYMKNTDLGFDKKQKLVVPVKEDYLKDRSYELLKSKFLRFPEIKGATVSSGVPGRDFGAWGTSLIGEEEARTQRMFYNFVDHDFLSEYEIEVIAGRPFDKEIITDADRASVVNRAVVNAFGLENPDEALGKRIKSSRFEGTIIGVVKDFHFQGLHNGIQPVVLACGPEKGTNRFNPFGCMTLTINVENLSETISKIKNTWQEFHPDIPFEYYFVDSIFEGFYRSDERTGRLFGVFAFMGIFIACLGLFGLASFTAEQRTKEIGIRKVMGASIPNVLQLSQENLSHG